MAAEEYRRAQNHPEPNTVVFEVDEDLTPLSGIAIVDCLDEFGQRITGYLSVGQIDPQAVIGQLITVSDQLRASFVDSDTPVEEVFDFGEDSSTSGGKAGES